MTDILLEEDGAVPRLVLSRAAKRNAINRAMYEEAAAAIANLTELEVGVAVLASSEATFCAGADLSEMSSGFNAPEELGRCLADSGILWVAEVGGGVLGSGVSLVASCPVVFATEEAWFCLPELQHGFYPAPVVASLASVGLSERWAHAIAMTTRRVPAYEALQVGLVSEVVQGGDAELRARVDAYASQLSGSRHAVAQCVRSWPPTPRAQGLDATI